MGKFHLNNWKEIAGIELAGFYDPDDNTAHAVSEKYQLKRFNSVDKLIAASDIIDVVAPTNFHFEICEKAIRKGKHVFVEKPLALNIEDAELLSAIAKENNLQIMVGHLLQYHPAFITLLKDVKANRLGKLQYIQSHRLSFGKVRSEENILWSFSPHDISMILAIVGRTPRSILAQASTYITKGIVDIATLHLKFDDNINAHVMTSWMHPMKEHRLIVIGEQGALIFDDSLPWEQKLTFYNNKIVRNNAIPTAEK